MLGRLPKKGHRALTAGGLLCSLVGGGVLWKDYVAGKVVASHEADQKKDTAAAASQEGKVFVVTGANRGIGKALAWELAWLKGKVYMACRDLDKCEEARQEIVLATQNKYVYCRQCDLSSLASVRKFVEQFGQKEDKLDVLVCNAGVMAHPRAFSVDGVETHLAVNFLGHFLLADLLTPALAAAAPSRIVYAMNLDYRSAEMDFDDLNMTIKWDKTKAFERSQLANMLTVLGLSERLRSRGVTVNAAYPGVVATDIKRHMGVDKSVTAFFIANPLLWLFTKKPGRGAQVSLYLAIDPAVTSTTGCLFSPQLRTMEVAKLATDPLTIRRMLAVGQYWTGQAGSKDEAVVEGPLRTSS